MIKRATLFASLFIVLFTGISLLNILTPLRPPPSESTKLSSVREPSIKNKKKILNQQIRKGVSKDFWVSRGNKEGLHHYIESPISILTAIESNNQIELVEDMLEIQCYSQERVEKKEEGFVQNIRYIRSEKGTYRYASNQFDAPTVFLALYRMPGNTLLTHFFPQAPYLQGTAQQVTLSLFKGSPHFEAKTFKANVLTEPFL